MHSSYFAFKAIQRRYTKALSICGIVLASAVASTANAYLIEISTASFTPSAGYGVDASETSSPTLLGVVFSTSAFSSQSFTLSNINDSMTFNFGTVQLTEPNAGGGIEAAETNDLGVLANLLFTSPIGATRSVSATGTATVGSVSDSAIDYILNWTPITANFGNGGSFEISMLPLSFVTQQTLTQQATIRLLSLSQDTNGVPPPISVPAPNTWALFGLGLAALGYVQRRKIRR